jgi:hypothetical protein
VIEYAFPEVFDSSMLAAFKSCPQLFYKVYIANWKTKTDSVHLTAGGAFAKGIEVAFDAFFVKDHSAEDSLALGLQALIKHYGDFQCPPESAKSLERMMGALEFYFQNYPLNKEAGYPIILPGGRRGIEFSFVHALPINNPSTGNPILFCGRLDGIRQYAGAAYGFDEKTTSRLGPTWSQQWNLRSQFIGYKWGCKESNIAVQGIVVRGVSILKTKYETQESINDYSDWEVDRWYLELIEWIEEMIKCWKTNRWRYNLDHACTEWGGCGFKSVCKSQNEQPWLETYFERRYWNPVTREETLL